MEVSQSLLFSIVKHFNMLILKTRKTTQGKYIEIFKFNNHDIISGNRKNNKVTPQIFKLRKKYYYIIFVCPKTFLLSLLKYLLWTNFVSGGNQSNIKLLAW